MGDTVKLLTPKQVAAMFQLSLATLSRMAGAGQIPYIVLRTGRRKKVIRFRTEEIEAWLRTHTHGGAADQGAKRTRGRKGNTVATQKVASLQVPEPQGENGEGHRSICPVSEV